MFDAATGSTAKNTATEPAAEYMSGFNAYVRGADRDDNPHAGTAAARWEDGWISANIAEDDEMGDLAAQFEDEALFESGFRF